MRTGQCFAAGSVMLVAFATCMQQLEASDQLLFTVDQVDLSAYAGRVQACGITQWSEEGSDSCSCKAGFELVNGLCEPCGKGSYKGSAGNIACTLCSTNMITYRAATSASECMCDVGFGWDGSACHACLADSYKPFVGNVQCVQCPSNSKLHTPTTTSTVANCLCDKGHYLDQYDCKPCAEGAYKSTVSDSACLLCDTTSEWSPGGSISEAACLCRAGFGYVASSDLSCEACDAGKYKEIIADVVCDDCPDHSTSPGQSTNLTSCECVQGYTGENGAACQPCAKGEFKGSLGSAACQACADDDYSDTGASRCEDCPTDHVLKWSLTTFDAPLLSALQQLYQSHASTAPSPSTSLFVTFAAQSFPSHADCI